VLNNIFFKFINLIYLFNPGLSFGVEISINGLGRWRERSPIHPVGIGLRVLRNLHNVDLNDKNHWKVLVYSLP